MLVAGFHVPIRNCIWRWCILAAAALAGAGIWWATFTRHMWLPSFYDVPHLDTPKLLGVSEETMRAFALATGLELVLYGLAFVVARPLCSRLSAAAVLLLAVPITVPMILAYPGGAGDVYAYVAEADSVLQYHVNPFHLPVSAIPGHTLLPFLDFPNETTHYGPLWVAMAVGLRFLSGTGLLSALLVFKLAAVASLLAAAWLVFLTVRRTRPGAAVSAALLVAWNPLLIEEFAQNAHNDIVMALLVVLAFYLQARGNRRGAIAALIAACLVKYVAIVIIPLFLLADLREAGPWRKWALPVALDAVGAAVLTGAIVLALGLEGTVGILQKLSAWFTTSASAAAYYYLIPALSEPGAAAAVNLWVKVLFVAAYAVILLGLWRRPTSLAVASLWALVAFLAIATTWFQPWYVGWAIPVAALAFAAPAIGALGGMTAGGFMVHLVMGFAWRLDWHHGNLALLHAIGAAVMWLPVATGFALALFGSRWLKSERATTASADVPPQVLPGSEGRPR